ncbi:MAG: transcriptional regulator, partial [Caldilineaceae bacterium]
MHYRQTLRLLGDFRVTVDDEPVYGRVSPRVQTLLTYVVLHADEAVSRQRVAFDLWPDSNDVQARTNLRKLLHELRSSLPDADDCLISTNTTLQWNAHAPYSVDVVLLREALAQADHDPDDLDAHRRVGELYTGELLPRCYDDWVAPLRAELQRAVHDALSRLADKLEVARAYDDAVRYARQLAELDPLDEIAAQRLMRLYLL